MLLEPLPTTIVGMVLTHYRSKYLKDMTCEELHYVEYLALHSQWVGYIPNGMGCFIDVVTGVLQSLSVTLSIVFGKGFPKTLFDVVGHFYKCDTADVDTFTSSFGSNKEVTPGPFPFESCERCFKMCKGGPG